MSLVWSAAVLCSAALVSLFYLFFSGRTLAFSDAPPSREQDEKQKRRRSTAALQIKRAAQMSTPFDHLLVDPDEDTLARALEEASRSSGARVNWRHILDKMASSAEGRSQLERDSPASGNTYYLAVAWWTDHQSGRHVRVCGGNLAERRHPHYSRMDEDTRPPLWHVYPEHVYSVHRAGEEPVWLASCTCGVTGRPEALAWMGPCCGPCHDRREEGEVLPFAARPTILDQQDGPICSLAFSPDGNTLAVSSKGRRLYLYDLRDGSSEWLYSSSTDYAEHDDLRPLVFSPNGQFLAAGEHDVWSARIWRLDQTEDNSEVLFTNEYRVETLVFSPDSRQLAAVTSMHALVIWRQLGGEWHDQEYSQEETVFSVDFSPDGSTVALGGHSGRVTLMDFPRWKVLRRLAPEGGRGEDVLFLHYTPTGSDLVAVTATDTEAHFHDVLLDPSGAASSGDAIGRDTEAFPVSEAWKLRLWDLATRHERDWAPIPIISALAMAPDGRYLAWIVHDSHFSPAEVTIWDIDEWRDAGRLEWNAEDDLRELAFSPDGQTLAIGSASGVVKLVPWKLLLEG
jgi:WD40 repeat protein